MGTFSEELKTFWNTFYKDESTTVITTILMELDVSRIRSGCSADRIDKLCDVIQVDKSSTMSASIIDYRDKFCGSTFDIVSEPQCLDTISGVIFYMVYSYFLGNDKIKLRIEMKHSYTTPHECTVRWYVSSNLLPERTKTYQIEFKIHKNPITGRLCMITTELSKDPCSIEMMSRIGGCMSNAIVKFNSTIKSEWDQEDRYINRILQYVIGSNQYELLPKRQIRIEQKITFKKTSNYKMFIHDPVCIKMAEYVFQLYPQKFIDEYICLYYPEFHARSSQYASYESMMETLGLRSLREPMLFGDEITKISMMTRLDIWNTSGNVIIVFSVGIEKDADEEDTLFVVTMNTAQDNSLLTTNVVYNDKYLDASEYLTLREDLHVAACEYLSKLQEGN